MVDGNRVGPAAEPVAVVGIGCRFAGGADTPEAFWELLRSGTSATGEVPPDRWRHYRELRPDYAAVLRRTTSRGAFLDDIEGFDADFFGLTPREAGLMDPQQRILLEVAWEALEHAGIPPRALAGTDAGVFVGVGSDDHSRQVLEDLPRIEAWTGIGAAMCAVANRISYALDLRGPSLSVDTACSASLVATHLACQSLRLGESTIALAAGVNLMVGPGLTVTLDAAGALASDGRSKSFDASADGYGRGEGCGVLVLKRLSDAQRDGDRILSVILGSAVNQDGHTNGIMAPSGTAQQHVLDRACRHAGVAPGSVDYVEAHGTGTRVGDPLEASALTAVYGVDRPGEDPCLIGSVKSNIGHLEAAAGVAGLIKAILSLDHAEIPASLHYTAGNPAVDWANAGLKVVSEHRSWPERDHPRRAGVSGFGYGGTIAHVVLEQAPQTAGTQHTVEQHTVEQHTVEQHTVEQHTEPDAVRLYPLSAASEAALHQYAAELAEWLENGDVSLASLGHTLALRRSPLEHRAVVLATTKEELVARLRLLAADESSPEVVTGRSVATGAPVWVLSGHGSQWIGMGRDLLATEPAFAAVVDDLEPVFQAEIGFSPRQVLLDGSLDSVDRIQAMIFVMQLGLAEVWRTYGVVPGAIIGHSVGEIAAAVLAGALSRVDGAKLICRRSNLLTKVAGQGAMVMASLPFDEVRARLAGRTDAVAAIWSSPLSTVVSGDPAAIEELLTSWRAEGVAVRRVSSDVAFHSPHMDVLLDGIVEAAADLSPNVAAVSWYSTALEDPRATVKADGSYWATNLRQPVRLAGAVQAAAEDGHRAFLELSAHPVVAHSIGETLPDQEFDVFVGTTLRRERPEQATLLAAIAAAHCHGIDVDWTRLQPSGGLVTLPPPAWQHRRHRTEVSIGTGTGGGHDIDSHTLLGSPTAVAEQRLRLWQTVVDETSLPYPGNHTINGVEIVPAAVLINTFRQAMSADLNDVDLVRPLTVAPAREVQVIRDGTALRVASREGEGPWVTHTTAVAAESDNSPLGVLTGDGPADQVDPDTIVQHLASVGVPTMAFTWTVDSIARGTGALRARVTVEQPSGAPATWAPVLDAALSAAPLGYPGEPVLRMVAHVAEVRLTESVPEQVIIDVTAREDTVDILIADTEYSMVGRLTGVRYATMDEKPAARPQDLVHALEWRPLELPEAAPHTGRIVLVGPSAGEWTRFTDSLVSAGADIALAVVPDALADLDAPCDVVVLPPQGDAAGATWLATATAQMVTKVKDARMWIVTSGVRDSRDEAALAHAPLWGLGRIIGGEHAESWGGVVDIDDPSAAARTLLAIIGTTPGEDVISVRGAGAEVARLAPMTDPAGGAPLSCRADGTYLITGGLGVLGLEIARWMANRGARRLVLAARQALPARSTWDSVVDEETRRRIDGVRALEALGVTVRVVAVDIASAATAAAALDMDELGLPPIRGVVHAAGVLDNRMLADVDEASVRAVLRPKVEGALVLHDLFPPGSVDFLVLFSSCGQFLSLPGQATYASANAFLDALARHRGAGTLSLAWTSWRGMGMAANRVVELELRARGVSDISPDEAFGAWDDANARGDAFFAILRAVTPEPAGPRAPVLSELVTDETGDGPEESTSDAGLLAELPPEELHERLVDEVRTQVAAEMRLASTDIDPRRSLAEQGLDSVMTIVIRRRLEKRFGHSLPATLLWHQPTVSAIVAHLTELIRPAGAPEPVAV